MPSAPAAEEAFSSAHAAAMSFSENDISVSYGSSAASLSKNSLASFTTHSGLGFTNTYLYCLPSSSAAKSGSGFG